MNEYLPAPTNFHRFPIEKEQNAADGCFLEIKYDPNSLKNVRNEIDFISCTKASMKNVYLFFYSNTQFKKHSCVKEILK